MLDKAYTEKCAQEPLTMKRIEQRVDECILDHLDRVHAHLEILQERLDALSPETATTPRMLEKELLMRMSERKNYRESKLWGLREV